MDQYRCTFTVCFVGFLRMHAELGHIHLSWIAILEYVLERVAGLHASHTAVHEHNLPALGPSLFANACLHLLGRIAVRV